jgi:hypothetical protein
MSFLHNFAEHHDPLIKFGGTHGDPVTKSINQFGVPDKSPPPPGVPNPNDAANAAQSTTDAMRMRRGLLANIYAGGQQQQPVTGKTQLGT